MKNAVRWNLGENMAARDGIEIRNSELEVRNWLRRRRDIVVGTPRRGVREVRMCGEGGGHPSPGVPTGAEEALAGCGAKGPIYNL